MSGRTTGRANMDVGQVKAAVNSLEISPSKNAGGTKPNPKPSAGGGKSGESGKDSSFRAPKS